MRRRWTDREIWRFIVLYPDRTAADLARIFRRTRGSVNSMAQVLGLRKSAEHMRRQAERLNLLMAHRFRPGHRPWNAGLKGWNAGGRSAETRFRPGNVPPNWMPVGSYRVSTEGYLQQKVSDTGYPPRDWLNVHRLVWQQQFGPIPDGYAVVFRPGMKTTVPYLITPDRLECIPRSELMRRNSRHRLPRALDRLIAARAALTRIINRRKGATK